MSREVAGDTNLFDMHQRVDNGAHACNLQFWTPRGHVSFVMRYCNEKSEHSVSSMHASLCHVSKPVTSGHTRDISRACSTIILMLRGHMRHPQWP